MKNRFARMLAVSMISILCVMSFASCGDTRVRKMPDKESDNTKYSPGDYFEATAMDKKYFVPGTGDYIVARGFGSNAYLNMISFDENGKCVDWIVRSDYASRDNVTIENASDYYWRNEYAKTESNEAAFGAKFYVLRECMRGFGDDEFSFYVSKKLTPDQTKTSLSPSYSDMDIDEISDILNDCVIGPDYYLTQSGHTKDEYIYTSEIGRDNSTFTIIDQQVRGYHTFHYIEEWVFEYGGGYYRMIYKSSEVRHSQWLKFSG